MTTHPILEDRNEIYRLYYNEDVSQLGIAELIGVDVTEVQDTFHEKNIPRKVDVLEAEPPTDSPDYHDRLMLIKWYWVEGKSIEEIKSLDKVDVESNEAIRFHMVKHDIPRRRRGRPVKEDE